MGSDLERLSVLGPNWIRYLMGLITKDIINTDLVVVEPEVKENIKFFSWVG